MDSEPLILSQAVYDDIITHAREGKPEEVCGLLRGRENRAFAVVRGRNVAADKINNYDVDTQTLLRQFEFEEAGDRMVAIYHSHPISPAYPSATDAWSAEYPETYYLICSLEDDNAPVSRAYRLIAHFPELDVEHLRRALAFYETRPALFGYYQPAEKAIPPSLQALSTDTDMVPPFYLVFNVDENGTVEEHRLVTVREHPVQVAS